MYGIFNFPSRRRLVRRVPVFLLMVGLFVCASSSSALAGAVISTWQGNVDDDYMRNANWDTNNAPDGRNDEAIIVDASPNPDPVLRQSEEISRLTLTGGLLTITPGNVLRLRRVLRGTSGTAVGLIRGVRDNFQITGTPTVENFRYHTGGGSDICTVTAGAYLRCTGFYEQAGAESELIIRGGGAVDCRDFRVLDTLDSVTVETGGLLLVNGGSYTIDLGGAYTTYEPNSTLRFMNTTVDIPFADVYGNLEAASAASFRDLNGCTVANDVTASGGSNLQFIGATLNGTVVTDGTSYVVSKDHAGSGDYRFYGVCDWTAPEAVYDTEAGENIYIMPGATVTLDADVTVANLTVYPGATLNLNGYTLTVAGNADVQGTVNGAAGGGLSVGGDCAISGVYNANGETLDVAGTLTVSGTYNGLGGTCRVNGVLTVTNTGLMHLQDALALELETGITVDGVFRTSNGKPTVTNDGAGNYSFNVSASGTLDVTGMSFFNADTNGMVVADGATITSLDNVDFGFLGAPGVNDGTYLQILDTSGTFTFNYLFFDDECLFNVRTTNPGVSVTVDGWDGPRGGSVYENDNDSGQVDPGTIVWLNYLAQRPEIVFRDPGIGQVNVPVTATITVRFSRQMDQTTITNIDGNEPASSYKLEDSGSGFVNCNISFPDAYTAVLTPDSMLTAGETYTVMVKDTIADIFGVTVLANSWTFTCVPPNTLTVAEIVVPGAAVTEGATFLAQRLDLTAGAGGPIDVLDLTFTMNGTAALSDIALVELYEDTDNDGDWTDEGPPLDTGTYATPSLTLTLPGFTVGAGATRYLLVVYTLANPAADTNPNSTVDADLTAVSMNPPNLVGTSLPIASDDFTIVTPPAVSLTYPADGQTEVFTAITISVTFDEAMNLSTITNVDGDLAASSFRLILECDSSFVNCDNSFSGTDTAILTPDVELHSGEWYTVEIDTRVTDSAGNAIPALYSWRFQCGNPNGWDGDIDTNWTLGNNWNPDAAPGQNDDVQVPSAATVPNNPNVNKNSRIRNVLMASGSILNFSTNNNLRVKEDFMLQTGADGPGTVNFTVDAAHLILERDLINDGQIIIVDGNDRGAVQFRDSGILQTWSGTGVIEVQSNTERVTVDLKANVQLGSDHTVRGGVLNVRNNATMSLDAGGYTLALDFYGVNTGGHLLIDDGGTFNCGDGTLRIAGKPVIAPTGTFNRDTGTFYWYGTSPPLGILDLDPAGFDYYNLRFGAGVTYTLPANPTWVENDLIIDAATTLDYDVSTGLVVHGDWLDDGTFLDGGGTVELAGVGVIDANTAGAGTETFNNLNVTGNRTLSANDTMTVSGLLDISGTFNSGTATTINVIASKVTRTGAVNPDTGTWVYTDVGNFADFDIYNLTTAGAVTMAGDFSVLNDLRVNGGGTHFVDGRKLIVGNRVIIEAAGDKLDASLVNSEIEVGGDWLNDGSFVYGTSRVEFNGSSLLDVEVGADAEETMYDVVVTGALTIQHGDNLNIINTLDVAAGGTLTLGDGTFLLIDAPNFTVAVGASFDPGTSSTVVAGATGTIPSVTYANLRIEGDIVQTGPIQVNGDLTVATGATFDVNGQDLTIRGDILIDGMLDATAGGNILIEGDWDAVAGLFDDINVNVIFNGGGTTINNLQVSSGSEVTIARDTTITDLALDNAELTLVNGSSITVTTDTTFISNSIVEFDDTNGAPDLTISGLLSTTDTAFVGNVALTAARYDLTTSTFTGNALSIISTGGAGSSSFDDVAITAAFSLDMDIAENLDLIGVTTINVTDQIDNASFQVLVAGDMVQGANVLIRATASYINPGVAPGGDATVVGNGGGGGAFWGRGGNASDVGTGGGIGADEYKANPFLYLQIGSKGGEGLGGARGGRGGGAIKIEVAGDYYFGGTVSAQGDNGENDAAGGGGGGGSGGYIYVHMTGDFIRTGSLFSVRGGNGGSIGANPQGGGGGGGGLIHLKSDMGGGITTEEVCGWDPETWPYHTPWEGDLGILGTGGGFGGLLPLSPWDNEFLGEEGESLVESGGNRVTYVRLYGLSAVGYNDGIVVMWHTGVEIDNFGFNVYRSTNPDDGFERINPAVILGLGTSSSGGHYAFRDLTVEAGTTYYYLVQDVEFDGDSMFHGPVHAMLVPGGSDPVDDPGTFVNVGSTDDEEGYNPPEPIPGITPLGGSEIATNVFLVDDNADGIFIEIFFPEYALVQAGAAHGDALRVEMLGHGYVSDLGTPELPVREVVISAPEAAAAHTQVLEIDYRDQLVIDESELRRPVRIEGNLVDPSVDTGARAGASWKSRRISRGWGDLSPSTEINTYPVALPDAYFPADPVSSEMKIRNGRPYVSLSASGARFNPHTRALEVHERMLVRITFYGPMPQQTNPYPGTEQEVAAAADSLKCYIIEPGLYRMTWNEFNASGIDLGFDPRNLKVYIGGEETAVTVTGENDGSFDPGDEVIFFADKYEDEYTDVNVAFIVPSDGPGRRCAALWAAPMGEISYNAHWTETIEFQDGQFYCDVVSGVSFYDRWQGLPIMPFPPYSPFYVDLDCPSVAAGSHTANLHVVMYASFDCSFISPDHRIRFYANGGADFIGDVIWDGRTYVFADLTFDQSFLSSGVNSVQGVMATPPPLWFDFVYPVRYELAYERAWEPVSDSFVGYTNLTAAHELSGFSAAPLAYDVTDTANPLVITGGNFTAGNFSFWAVPGRRYAVAAGGGISVPVWTVNLPSNIGSAANCYDMLIITHGDFRDAAETLADHRRTFDGISVLVADVEDVYDEFSFGRKSPDGMRNCVAAAVNTWAAPPLGVLLVGDGSPDPKGKFSGFPMDFIPTYFFDTARGYSASDTPYTTVLPDSELPAVGLGRIPCMTSAEADAVVQKIIDYDLNAPSGEWRKKVILAADNTDFLAELNDYAAVSDTLAAFVTPDYAIQKIYLKNDPSGTHGILSQAYMNGAAILNFTGHGARDIWAEEDIFNVSDVLGGPARPEMPFVVVSDCLTGGFEYPYTVKRCLAEEFMARGDAGAIAVLSSGGLTRSAGQFLLNQEVFYAIFVDGAETFGEISRLARIAVLNTPGVGSDSVKTFILFGDPMQKLVR